MKTAVSIPDDLFREIDRFARELKCSRSELFSRAARSYLEKLKSRALLEELNAAYSDVESEEDSTLRQRSKRRYVKKVLKQR